MSKKILLIESDNAFAKEMASAIEARGLDARITGDGREGLELARADRPDLVVLCVELPRMSGYSVCQKFKKDDALRAIPLVLTSAEATAETFEQHRKLKARADDYLLKPFDTAALVRSVAALLDLPVEEEVRAASDEVVTLDDVEELEAAAAAESAKELPSERDGVSGNGEDEDLRLLDRAFETLAHDAEDPAAHAGDAAAGLSALDADVPDSEKLAEVDAALAALGADDAAEVVDEPAPDRPIRAASAVVADAGGEVVAMAAGEVMSATSAAVAPPPSGPAAAREPAEETTPPERPGDGAVQALEARVAELLRDLARKDDELSALGARLADARDADAEAQRAMAAAQKALAAQDASEQRGRAAEQRAAEAEERARAAEVRATSALERASSAEEQARGAEARAAEAEASATEAHQRVEALEHDAAQHAADAAQAREGAEALGRDLEALRSELLASRGEIEGVRSEAEREATELRKRVAELEGLNARHEERVVKAYQKIKGDEKIREKTRKALAIALQLLEERTPGATSADVQPRRE